VEKASLKVRVNPRSSRNEITGFRDGVLSVKLTAPPVEGAANKACIDILSNKLGIRKSHIRLASGEKSRDKLFEVSGISQTDLHDLLSAPASRS
jgi:uncharacterized protein (TIGR00251 family)